MIARKTSALFLGLTFILAACGGGGGGGGGGTCDYIGGTTYTGTETLNGCGYSNKTTLVTYEFYQSKNSCKITVGSPLESCSGTLFDDGTLTWACPPYSSESGQITYELATATFSDDLQTLNGSFKWTIAGCGTLATTTLTNLKKN